MKNLFKRKAQSNGVAPVQDRIEIRYTPDYPHRSFTLHFIGKGITNNYHLPEEGWAELINTLVAMRQDYLNKQASEPKSDAMPNQLTLD